MSEKKYIEIEGTALALTPIFHGGDEKTGSTPVLRTILIYTEEYGEIPIPYLSGNSIRGKLRRLIMRDLFDLVGFETENPKVHHALFSGGMLESTEENTGVIDLAFRKTIRETLPPVSLLGCALGNQMIAGILTVEHLWPICEEYKIYLPEKFLSDKRASAHIRTFTDQSFITRRDDLRAERAEDEQAVQMKIDYECFVPGTKFYHRFIVQLPDAVQLSCMGRILDLFALMPYVGGRSSSGDGKVSLNYPDKPDGSLYLDFVAENKEQILMVLNKLEHTL